MDPDPLLLCFLRRLVYQLTLARLIDEYYAKSRALVTTFLAIQTLFVFVFAAYLLQCSKKSKVVATYNLQARDIWISGKVRDYQRSSRRLRFAFGWHFWRCFFHIITRAIYRNRDLRRGGPQAIEKGWEKTHCYLQRFLYWQLNQQSRTGCNTQRLKLSWELWK